MSPRPINRSPDLLRLRQEGYDIIVTVGHLVVRHVPYVTATKEVKIGMLVAPLVLADDVARPPQDHVIKWTGEYPCDRNGVPIEAIRNSNQREDLGHGLIINHTFSAKPNPADPDFYQKVVRYVALITGQAHAVDPTQTARPYRFDDTVKDDSPFTYMDTASSIAGIGAVSQKLEGGKVAIVGVGGTGSYILDLLAKTPVREIHIFDEQPFLQHNAFRSPGAASGEELSQVPSKTDYLAARYSNMHRGIVPHDYALVASNVEELRGFTFVFLCLDQGSSKRAIATFLREMRIPFIDVGMGVELQDTSLGGIVTVTTVTDHKNDHMERRIAFSDAAPNAVYSQNIQIADLNMLNAALAVIKWKKLAGFYRDTKAEHYTAFPIDGNILINEETA